MNNLYDDYKEEKNSNVLIDTEISKNNNFNKNNNINKKNIILSISLLIILVLVIVLAFVFKNFNENKDNSSKPNNSQEVDNNNQDSKINIIDINSNTRPYAVMINCHNGALPQAGLQNAYIVYELMVEGGITRMMALFKDKDVNKIGSIRSARTQYLDYVYENDAIYVHAGGAADALKRIKDENINDIDVDGVYGVRDTSLKRSWEHTLFTTTNLLKKGTSDRKFRNTTETYSLLKYTAHEITKDTYQGSQPANNISIKYSDYRTSNYVYDPTNKVYLRSMNNTLNVDLVTGEQYKVKNIIVYAVPYSNYTYNNNSSYQKIANVGTGEGLYITNGYSIPIIWEKASKNAKTIYKVKATGKELELSDGNTYIQIYPTSGSLKIS